VIADVRARDVGTTLRLMPRTLWWLGFVALAVTLGGCSSLGPDTSGAAGAAEAFHVATADGDGSAACSRLSVRVAEELAQSAGAPCEQAVLAADVPDAAQVRDVQVWGGRGLVVLDHDVVFVAEFDSGWRVTAAGCSARKDRPYDCAVKS
jgi:hypothetical protein